jgi:hypothetical protein
MFKLPAVNDVDDQCPAALAVRSRPLFVPN